MDAAEKLVWGGKGHRIRSLIAELASEDAAAPTTPEPEHSTIIEATVQSPNTRAQR